MRKKVLLFTLQTFSTTGGIQKMTRTLGHSLYQIAQNNNWNFELWSVYDKQHDLIDMYLPGANFKGFGKQKLQFIFKALSKSNKPDVVILSHINLASIGLLIKLLNPKSKIWLIAHGIEVWRPLSFLKKQLLKKCEKIICVSNYTQEQIINMHQVNEAVCTVLNNAIDPFMPVPINFEKPQHLLNRYGLTKTDIVIYSLTRLVSTERYKGYDQVIKVMGNLKLKFPGVKYVLAGKYDDEENIRIKKLIADYNLHHDILLTGFVNEDELTDHFLLADVFVLPSKKEGFGIVFIEAMACGLPVICGNADGSIDAIKNGELGKAVNPDDLNELENAITNHLTVTLTKDKRKQLQQKSCAYFNENNYMIKLQQLLNNE